MQDRRTAALAWSNKPLTMPVLPPESKIREEGRMKYYNARSALPEPLFREVQRYVRGAYLYVPRPNTPAGARYPARAGSSRSATKKSARSGGSACPRASWRRDSASPSTPYAR